MGLIETLEGCTNEVWAPRRMRRKRISALRRTASDGWSKRDITYFHEAMYIGWIEGVNSVYQLLDHPAMLLPHKNAVIITSSTPNAPLRAGYVAKAVGASLAIHFLRLDAHSAEDLVSRLEEPTEFIKTCASLLDEAGQGSGEALGGASQGDRMLSAVWATTAGSLRTSGSPTMDLRSGRANLAPF